MGVIADFFARLLRMCPGRLFPGFLLIRQEVRAIFKTWVVLENNNGHLTQLSAEGPPLFRALLAFLRE
jgi:hypothetical protein